MLTHHTRFNAAHHCLKLFGDGIKGTVGSRSSGHRGFATPCSACEGDDAPLTWCTPSPEGPGVTWCSGCRGGFDDTLAPWAWVLRRLGEPIPDELCHISVLPAETQATLATR